MTAREDVLVSLCLADFTGAGRQAEAVARLAREIAARFRYWEILVAVDAAADRVDALLAQRIPNLRVLRVTGGLSHYRRRVVVAAEAIGDLVLLGSVDELGCLDVVGMLERAEADSCIVMGDRGEAGALDPLIALIGRSGGFQVHGGMLQTMACPRQVLARLLRHPEQQLALRFPPAGPAFGLRAAPVIRAAPRGRRRGDLRRRLMLLQRLVVSSAPNVLFAISVASVIVTAVSLLFLVYAIVVWVALSDVQPGWLTTSLTIGMSAAFLGALGLGLGTGIQKIIDLLTRESLDDVIDEVGPVDLYAGIGRDLNVQYELSAGDADAPPPPGAGGRDIPAEPPR